VLFDAFTWYQEPEYQINEEEKKNTTLSEYKNRWNTVKLNTSNTHINQMTLMEGVVLASVFLVLFHFNWVCVNTYFPYRNYWSLQMWDFYYTPAPPEGGAYCFTSVRPSFRPPKIFFVAFFSATIDGRNLIFGHKLHIGMPYCGKRFWTPQIPISCLPT
jgi:hypothetical protein